MTRIAAAAMLTFALPAYAIVVLGRPRDLVPVRGTLFRAKDLAGVTVEFLRGADGRVDRIAVHSGSSTIGRRKG